MSYRNSAPIKIDNVDVSKITLTKGNDSSYGNLVYVNYNGGPLRVILPLMEAPMGCKKFADEKGISSNDKYAISFSFNGMETNPALQAAYSKLNEIDNHILDLVEAKKNDFYSFDANRAKLTRDEIRSTRWTDPLKKYTDKNGKEYPETFRVSIALDKKNPDHFVSIKGKPLLIDVKGNLVPVDPENVEDVIMRSCKIQGVVEISYMFIAKKKPHSTSIKWTFGHGVIHSVDSGDSWDLVDTSSTTAVVDDDEDIALAAAMDEEGDGELVEEEDEEEEEVVVETKPVKKVAKSKTPSSRSAVA